MALKKTQKPMALEEEEENFLSVSAMWQYSQKLAIRKPGRELSS